MVRGHSELYSPCEKAARVYEASIRRVMGLAGALGHAFMNGELWMNATHRAKLALPDVNENSHEFQFRCLQEFIDIAKWQDGNAFIRDHRKATHNADEHCFQIEPIYEGFYAIVQSVVILSWSAFEVLEEDLHTFVREECAAYFRGVPMQHKEYKFRRMDGVPAAYKRLFPNGGKIVSAIENSDVRALGLLRHLLVHKNGKVDQMHLDQRKEHPAVTQLDAFSLNSYVILNGSFVRSLMDPVTSHAFNLVLEVNAWLKAHKPK